MANDPDFDCAHVWIANTGAGGEPEFRLNRMMSSKPLMHVCCEKCNARTWFSEEQWNALAEDDAAQDAPGKDAS